MAGDHINALQVGHQLEEYQIERLLGHGGFGLTYLARDAHLDNLVAIKEYLPQEYAVRAANSTIVPKSQTDQGAYEWGLERFKQEARSLARFKHPNIVRAARLIEANGTAYMVMEYAHGMTLGEYLKHFGPTLDEATILAIFLPILDGLAALHRAEFIHRDIKPGNIYLRDEGGPMLIDFGAVRQAVASHSQSLTSVVTPGYAPIEQYSTEGRQGAWTDLYAVGATMYCCMLGRSPVDAARRSAAISDGDKDPLIPASRIGQEKGGYSDALLEAIDWAMMFRSKERPQTALDLKTKLLSSPVQPAVLVIPELGDSDRTTIGGGARSGTPSARPSGASRPPSRPPSRPVHSQPPSQPASQRPSGRMIPAPHEDEPTSLAPVPGPAAQPVDEPTSLAPVPGPAAKAADVEVASAPVEWFSETPSVPASAPVARPAAGSRIAQPSSNAPVPPKPSRVPLVLGALVVLGGAGAGGWWWNQQRQVAEQDRVLFEAAVTAASPDAYRAYLDNCIACEQRSAAEQGMKRLTAERENAADAVMQREVAEKVAALKTRFAGHLLAGEFMTGPNGSAKQVLDDLAVIAPADPFIAEGRERLAAIEADRVKAEETAKQDAAKREAAQKESAKVAATSDKSGTKSAPRTTKAAPAPKPSAPAPDSAATKLAAIMDGIGRFEVAMARDDLDGAGKAVEELKGIAPTDSLVKDAERRFDMARAKALQEQLAAQRKKREDDARAAELQRIADAALAAARTGGGSAPAAPVVGAPVVGAPTVGVPSRGAGGVIRDSVIGGAGPRMVSVSPGRFRMGDQTGVGAADERPAVDVTIGRPLAFGQREVTVAEFRAFADATGYRTSAERGAACRVYTGGSFQPDPRYNWREAPFPQSGEDPVVCVSWDDATAYARWLAASTGKRYRLPTEAEWEYGARAGSLGNFPWGNSVGSGQANCAGCGGRAAPRTLPTGSFGANAFGLYDTAGNVLEWTCSSYAPSYGGQEQQCTSTGGDRVMRGGGWALPPDRNRSSFRGYAARDYSSDNVGFRVVLEL